MKLVVSFASDLLELEVADDRLAAHWSGPEPIAPEQVANEVRRALESPAGFPGLGQVVVPGDRIALPFDADLPGSEIVLGEIVAILLAAGVESIHAIKVGEGPAQAPAGTTLVVHDPGDRDQLGYLANTSTEQRIYLNRALTDADCVIPIGTLGFDPVQGFRGPWSTLYPGLADSPAQLALLAKPDHLPPNPDVPNAAMVESGEVAWLLGSQFAIGVMAGTTGIGRVVTGLESVVRAEGCRLVDDSWTFRTPERADLVVVGVGSPGVSTSLAVLADALLTGMNLVRHGGKIVAISHASGPVGPSLKRLAQAGDPRRAVNALKGREADADYQVASSLAKVGSWADLYILSDMPAEALEDWSMIPLGKPEEVRRLVATAMSVIVVNHADRTRAVAAEDES